MVFARPAAVVPFETVFVIGVAVALFSPEVPVFVTAAAVALVMALVPVFERPAAAVESVDAAAATATPPPAPSPAPLTIAGVGAELIDELTVTCGFAATEGDWNCPVTCCRLRFDLFAGSAGAACPRYLPR